MERDELMKRLAAYNQKNVTVILNDKIDPDTVTVICGTKSFGEITGKLNTMYASDIPIGKK